MTVIRINYKKSPFVRDGWFICEICQEPHDRRSNSQKYCDNCRRIATSRKVAAYYRKNRKRILKKKSAWRKENKDEINAKQRQYNTDTKLERPTRPMLREMKESTDARAN